MIARVLRSLWRDTEGTALVEGSILLPVLMSLLFGVYEFSFFFYQQQLITTGVRDAARFLARNDLSSCTTSPLTSGNCSVTVMLSGTATNVVTVAKNIAVSGFAGGTPARVTGWAASNVAINLNSLANSGGSTPCGVNACSGRSTIQVVVVSTTFADPSLGLFGYLGLSAPNLVVSHAERVIGPG